MLKHLSILLFSLSILTTTVKAQDTFALARKIEKQDSVMALLNDFTVLFSKYLSLSGAGKEDSARVVNDLMITKLLTANSIEPTNPAPSQYLVSCYSLKNEPEQVIHWSFEALKYTRYYWDNEAIYNISIATSYITMGRLDSAKSHINKALQLMDENKNILGSEQFVKSIVKHAEQIYLLKDPTTSKYLRLTNQGECDYAISILKLIIPEAYTYSGKIFGKTVSDKIASYTSLCK